MELIYTAQRDGFEPGKRYRNPQHFDRAEDGVRKVVVVGDWPAVARAYEEAGVEVVIVEAPQLAVIIGGADSAVADSLIAELATIGVIVESFTEQCLARPEGELGETAGRLFEVFEAVNAGVTSLQRERDSEAGKVATLEREKTDLLTQNADLLKQIESVKAASADPDVEALKLKLDQASVTYRANASKESLEKLVADLEKSQQDS